MNSKFFKKVAVLTAAVTLVVTSAVAVNFANGCVGGATGVSGAGSTNFKRLIDVGNMQSAVVKEDGTVSVWGGNIGNPPSGLSDVIMVSGGYDHSLALKADGTVKAWGQNTSGQCNVPAGLTGVKAVSAGMYFSLALKEDGTVTYWGNGWYNAHIPPAGLNQVQAIVAGCDNSMALKKDGTVIVWGSNLSNQCKVPSEIQGRVMAISMNKYGCCLALKKDGTVASWGGAAVPQGLSSVRAIACGYGIFNELRSLRGVIAISVEEENILVLKSDGTLKSFGYNYYGQANVPAGLNLFY
jgi:alpha-tubulin suppressor-like RCC1 family protein